MSRATSPPPPPRGDYFSGRPAVRTRPSAAVLGAGTQAKVGTPGSPRTPLLARSISSQFGSPGSFRVEQEEHVVYELGARHLSAGFAGESRPRCVVRFGPDMGRRVGDYREFDPEHARRRERGKKEKSDWGAEYELYRTDIRALDLGLVEDKLDQAVRGIHADYLQLDMKPRKAVLAVPSLFPTPLLEIALKVLFNHYTQPPSVRILTTPILATVSAGLRHALVVDAGWEETVVTAVGEYKEVSQRRSVRAGKMLAQEMSKTLETEARGIAGSKSTSVGFENAEEVTERMGWCRSRSNGAEDTASDNTPAKSIMLSANPSKTVSKSFNRLSDPAETALFAANTTTADQDDHDLPIHVLAYRVLLALPLDLRAVCLSRIVVTGGVSQLPGLKHRLLQEIQHLVETRGWDPVTSYGSAKAHHDRILRERDANIASSRQRPPDETSFSPTKKPIQDSLPPSQRVHDDIKDPITLKAERHTLAVQQKDVAKSEVRGVETLGAWAGATLVASLRVRGVHEVEREEFLRFGVRDDGGLF